MEEEEAICRVCRSEGTLEQPLFHPCKCAGSIRHVHQDCLTEWLSHSRKQYCELCEHPYTFTPVYRVDMPEVLPTRLVVQQFQKKLAHAFLFALRAIAVGIVWLIVLPYFTVWVWRMYFYLGDHVSKRLSRLQQVGVQLSSATSTNNIKSILFNNALQGIQQNDTMTQSWLQEYKSALTLRTFLKDCFEGQIIACIVVVIFVAVFILREWIVQNIPMEAAIPAVEEEEQEEVEQQINLPEPPQPPQPPMTDSYQIIWDENDPIRPPSPIAVPRDSVMFDYSSFERENTRSFSLPPAVGSFHNEDHQQDTFNSDGGRSSARASSLQPETVARFSLPASEPHVPIQRGQPPHAPRLRHAEAPRPIQRIIEEEDDDFRDRPEVIVGAVAVERDDEENNADDEENNVEEFEGVLEAIGMNGSIWSLVQNSALMALLVALSLGAAVWMPYLIGILFIMTDTLALIRVPLKITRLLTDPLIDFLFMVCSDYIWSTMVNVYTDYIQSNAIFTDISTKCMDIFNYIKDNGLLFADSSHTTLADTVQSVTTNDTLIDNGIQYMTRLFNETEPMVESAFNRYQALATGTTAFDRFACIVVGYSVVIVVSCTSLSRITNNHLATAAFGRTANEAIRLQGIILKVAMFITVELMLFPIVCGFLLDASTMPLFKGATLLGRVAYFKSHPISSIFLHWFLGTGFMFLFAVLVTMCRRVVRPGVMWFIRDPNDPQFHPIREIIERPVFLQFKKIGASALIYLTVILVGVGGFVHGVHLLTSNVLPLRWSLLDYANTSNPLSIIPVDLILVQLGIPAIVEYFKPRLIIKPIFLWWAKELCRQLRLTSFMFGGRHPEEEGTLFHHTWWGWLTQKAPKEYPEAGHYRLEEEVSYFWVGQLLRVPCNDSVPIIERRRMLVPVDTLTLEPIDETEKLIGHPAASAPGGEEVNTVIVYSPPDFKERLLVFVLSMWLFSSISFCVMTIVPVALGRYIFAEYLQVQNNVHDIYSFVLGGSILLMIGTSISQSVKVAKEVYRQSNWLDSLTLAWKYTQSFASWSFRWTWFLGFFGLVIPFIFGILIELYCVLPWKELGHGSATVEVWPMWYQGFAFMLVFYRFLLFVPGANIRNIIRNVFRGGVGKMKIKESITKLLGPFLLFSSLAIGFPFIVAFIHIKIIPHADPVFRLRLVQIAYFGALFGIGACYLSKIGTRIGRRVTETIREDNYLVGRTLHNLDQ